VARVAVAALTLAFVVWRLGTGPFVDGIRTIDARVLLAALAIGVVTTVCCAWRWRIVADGLGVDLTLPAAIAAYYRSQFLNVVLPGGILGDVHRGVSHGRDASDVGRGLRAVGWERSAGQLIQILLSAVVLLVLPSPVRSAMPLVAFGTVLVVGVVLVVSRARPAGGVSRWARVRRAAAGDIRHGLLARGAWPGIVVASGIAVAGYAATFLIAARTTGTPASAITMLPLAMLVLLAMVLPNIGGWGPREGITAWLFAAAGLGAAQGVTTAVVFGVMTFVATLPGAVVLVVAWLMRDKDAPPPEHARPRRMRVAIRSDGATDV
jgi:uncharacterized membrane protein YbhN (UPF0104 family)